eukprot:3618992-Lingulodinium_polyedra.AAC.1
MACSSKRVSEQFSRESCSDMRAETYSTIAVPRVSRCAHFMRRPPCGGRRVECVSREKRGVAPMECSSERVSEQLSRESCSENAFRN